MTTRRVSHRRFGRVARRVRSALAGLLAAGLVVAGSAAPAAGQQPADHRLLLGYYVPYDSTSWFSLQAHADDLDIVAAQWVTIDGCGQLGSRDDQTLKRLARDHNLRVVPSLLTLSAWLNHQVLTDETATANAIDQIVNYTLAIPAKERDVTVGWAGAYDYAALGAPADLVTIMAYEYRGPFSGPGSVAPFDWVQRVARFATSQIPAEKVLLGLAFYGYDWNTTSGGTRSIGYPQFAALAERYAAPVSFDPAQRSLTFEYEGIAGEPTPGVAPPARPNHVIHVRPEPPCEVQPPPAPPPPPRPPAPQAGTPQAHAVWLEDAASAAARLDLAAMYRTGGVAAWRLGLEDPTVWDVFRSWLDR